MIDRKVIYFGVAHKKTKYDKTLINKEKPWIIKALINILVENKGLIYWFYM